MRLAWCRRTLLALARRWGVYALVVLMGISAGAVGALQIAAAIAAASVLPLFRAVTQTLPLPVFGTAAQALVGAALVWVLRPLLLPQRWLEAERALPLPQPVQRRSDALLVALALLPLWGLYAAGAASVLGQDPAWLRPHRGAALGALVLAGCGSVALGVLLLQGRRRAPRYRLRAGRTGSTGGKRRWPLVLLLLPLWRGPARRLGALLAASALLLLLPVAGLVLWPQGGGWWLAALAAAGFLLSGRAALLVREEIGPLLAAASMLPLPPRTLARRAALLPLLPLLPAQAALPAWLLAAGPPVRPGVLLAYGLAAFGAAAWQAQAPAAQDQTAGARWLLLLALQVALASEVLL
jgi:hypothetical protein